jgi:hypothetical protein
MNANRVKFVKIPEAQRRHTAAWMREWQLQERLEASQDSGTLKSSRLVDDGRAPCAGWRTPADPLKDPFPAPGHIRLLQAGPDMNSREPLYVAVISDWEDGLVLAAPFSSYQAPATGGELLTGRPEPALAVLSTWSTFSVSPFLLAKSWYCDQVDNELLDAAWQTFRHVAAGVPLSDALIGRVGAPIVNPLDPRITYQRHLAARVAPLIQTTAQLFADITVVESEQEAAKADSNLLFLMLFLARVKRLSYAAQDLSSQSVALVTHNKFQGPPAVRHVGAARLLAAPQPQMRNPQTAEIRFSLHAENELAPCWHPEDGDMLRLARIEPDGTLSNLALGGILPVEGYGATGILFGAWSVLENEQLGADHVLIIAKA